MLRWFLNRLRKKEKKGRLRLHPPTIIKRDDLRSNYRLQGDPGTRRDNPLNHIYEEIQDPGIRRSPKKVHFLESKFHSVSDISQVAKEQDILPETHRLTSSLVNIDTIPSSPDGGTLVNTNGYKHPVKPPRKPRSGTRRWHTMLEKSERKPVFVEYPVRDDRSKTRRLRLGCHRHGDNYYLEHGDSDSGYENSNCSSAGSDVMDASQPHGYDHYLSKIEQLRLLEEEVDDLMQDLNITDVSEAHKLINSRINCPRSFLRLFPPSAVEQWPQTARNGCYSKLPDPCNPSSYPRNSYSCESLENEFGSFENTAKVRDDFSTGRWKPRDTRFNPHKVSMDIGTDNASRIIDSKSPLYKFPGYRKAPLTATVSRHHTVGEADVSRSWLPNNTLRELIRTNYHRQNVVAKM